MTQFKMGRRMLQVLEDLDDNSPSIVKDIILRVEGLEELPGRKKTKTIYSAFNYSLTRLLEHGFIEWVAPYRITEKGERYIRIFTRDSEGHDQLM